MKKLLLLPLFLWAVTTFAQPAGYTPGTQVCWTINGRPHGYFKAAGNGERHILISFTGGGETNCTNYQVQSPQKMLNDAGINWDGRTVRAPGDTIVWEVFTILNTSDYSLSAYAADINYFFQHIGAVDTSDHSKFHLQGLSGGVRKIWGFVTNHQGHNSPYRHIFSTTISMSGGPQADYVYQNMRAWSQHRRHWVWHGAADTNPQALPPNSQRLYDSLGGTKYLTMQAGGTHGANTWDSCLSRRGNDTTTNRWLWMAGPSPVVQPPADPYPGGPAGYIPGTQVCWSFNGRPHGYFRAAGNGERHMLIAFTENTEDSCDNYQTQSPQKLFEDAGINWNGRMVRAPGDTVIWEVLSIVNTSNYSLAAYATDINYFFDHVSDADTSDHTKFHIAGIGNGVNRLWGYVTNHQGHNSPYRNIFGTTISAGGAWLTANVLPLLRPYSIGRRHWIWHGTADGGGTPPAVSQRLYDSLSGVKILTLQAGGTHGADTWDSCFSLAGADTSTNRWLWMVANANSSFITNRQIRNTLLLTPAGGPAILYPNPAGKLVTVQPSRAMVGAVYSLTIIDMAGRVQKRVQNIRSGRYQADISALPRGLYLVQLVSDNEQVRQLLLKQ